MKQDLLLANIVSIVNGIAFEKGTNKKALDNMYKMEKYKSKFPKTLENNVNKLLDKFYNLVEDKVHKRLLLPNTILNIFLLLNELIIKRKDVKVTNWKKFMDWFIETHQKLSKLTKGQKDQGYKETPYKNTTRLGKDSGRMKLRLEMLIEAGLYKQDFITLLDKQRVVSDSIFKEIWLKYDKKCATCGTVVPLHKAIKGHRIAHTEGIAKGGVTAIENTIPQCESCSIPTPKEAVVLNEYI